MLNYIQDVTYWAVTGFGADGEVFAAPVTFKGRWEDRNEAFLLPSGEETVSNAVVYCAQQVAIGGYLLLGTSVAVDPTSVTGARKIRQSISIPDLRHIRTEYRGLL